MQAHEQINQKASDLIGKKQIGSCQNPAIYTLLSHITLLYYRGLFQIGGKQEVEFPPLFLANTFIWVGKSKRD